MATSKTPPEKPRKFQVVYKDDDGTESIWKYDLDKTTNGPVSVEQKYPPGYDKMFKEMQKKAALEKKGKIGELHDAFAKLDEKRKKAKAKKEVTKVETPTTKNKKETKPTTKKVKLKEDKGYW
jgi:hypothetical protein